MADYLKFWTLNRARKAFDGSAAPVRALENGWFRNLEPGDVLWLLTGDTEHLWLVIRMPIVLVTRMNRHPKYAVGNSKVFTAGERSRPLGCATCG